MKFSVRVITNYNTNDYDTFMIDAEDYADAQVKAIDEVIERGYDHEDLEGVYEVEEEKVITKKSTWEYSPDDKSVKAGGDLVVDTIETWIWDSEEEIYILDRVIEKDTGDEITLYEIIKDSNPLL